RIHDPAKTGIHVLSPSLRVIYLEGGPPELTDPNILFEHVPAFIQRMEDFLEEGKLSYDLVYAHYWLSGLVGAWIAKNRDLPLVLTFHTLIYFKPPRPGDPVADRRRMAEDHLIEVAAGIISSSEEERSFLVGNFELPKHKVRCIHPGVNADLFSPGTDEEVSKRIKIDRNTFSLLYVGRIIPEKGLVLLLEVIAGLRETHPDVFERLRLGIIGGGENIDKNRREPGGHLSLSVEDRLRAFVKEKDLGDNVIFEGPVKHEELRFYYSAADACVIPSFSESFGLVMAEALACGTPVLASGVGEMRHFIRQGKNGYLFSPEDPDSLRDGLLNLMQKGISWKPDRIRENITSRLSWNNTAAEILAYLKDILLKSPSQ
ncbi:MAG: glycosyltransferase, partial [Candidatus Aminicenantes bacterium]|nr:glycosyltransferase [Candidatus Aminicenantes bacterium]